MSFRLIVQPEAEDEITKAALWYNERSTGVRVRFLQAVERVLENIRRNPLQYQVVSGRVRRVMVGRFPYALMYVASEQDVNVVACFHCSRDPRRLRNRIPS